VILVFNAKSNTEAVNQLCPTRVAVEGFRCCVMYNIMKTCPYFINLNLNFLMQ